MFMSGQATDLQETKPIENTVNRRVKTFPGQYWRLARHKTSLLDSDDRSARARTYEQKNGLSRERLGGSFFIEGQRNDVTRQFDVNARAGH